ncbi:MAG TPA: flavin reductase family protein [Longimicrobiales bacterium]
MDTAEFRRIMGHFATGVAVVTSRDAATDAPCGLTVNTLTSVSLRPMLVLVCVEKGADSHDCILGAGCFAINLLTAEQERLSRRFASWDMEEKFRGILYRTEATGAPVLEEAMGWLDCRVWAAYPGGDHTIIVGEVVAGDVRDEPPLIYFRGGYGRFAT